MANCKITLTDEFGEHSFESDSDCITIIDDGEGNVSFVEGCDDDDTLKCDSCKGYCAENGFEYCVFENDEKEP